MSGQNLDATVRFQPPLAVLDLHGEINGFAEKTLWQAYHQAVANRPGAILLNFADVDYINSTGIALIVTLMAQARQAGAPLMACGLSQHYIEIFAITRLSEYMPLFADEARARASIKEKA
jgi:anti-anti-sigma factor